MSWTSYVRSIYVLFPGGPDYIIWKEIFIRFKNLDYALQNGVKNMDPDFLIKSGLEIFFIRMGLTD